VVLSADEVKRLLLMAPSLKARTMLTISYGCGLRAGEVTRLTVGDIDSAQGIIRVVQAKGRKDRNVMLPPAVLALGGGFAVWLAMYVTVPRPIRTYVLAHELTHAFWAAMMGVRVFGLKVGKDGGSVMVAESNVLIVLAPYFFPLYVVLIVLAFGLGNWFLDLRPYLVWFHLLVGAAYAFHLTFTWHILETDQTDIGHKF
jgi:hypothetical protein